MAYIKNKELFAGTTSCMTALACLWANTMKREGHKTKNQLRRELLDKKDMLDGPESIVPSKPCSAPNQPDATSNELNSKCGNTSQSPPPAQQCQVQHTKENVPLPVKQNLNTPSPVKKRSSSEFMIYPSGNNFLVCPIKKQQSPQKTQQQRCSHQSSLQKQHAEQIPLKVTNQLNQEVPQSKVPIKLMFTPIPNKILDMCNQHCCAKFAPKIQESPPSSKCPKQKAPLQAPGACQNAPQPKIKASQLWQSMGSKACHGTTNQVNEGFREPRCPTRRASSRQSCQLRSKIKSSHHRMQNKCHVLSGRPVSQKTDNGYGSGTHASPCGCR